MAFPTNPINGQQATVNGVIYTYVSATPAWSVTTNAGANVSANNISAVAAITAASVSASGNVYAGNLINSGSLTVTSLVSSGLLSTTGNIAGANLLTAGLVSASGNVFGGGILASTTSISPSSISGAAIGQIYDTTSGFAAPGIGFGAGTGSHGAIVYGANLMYFGSENGIASGTMTTRMTLSKDGVLSVTGNIIGSNLSATLITGTLTTAAQTNITSVGTLGALTVTATITGSVNGSAATFTSTSQNSQFNSVGIGTAASTTAGEIRATNNITAYYSSDQRLKTNIKPITDALGIVFAVGGKTFDWTDEYIKNHGGEDDYFMRKSDFGIIAQDIEQVFPQAVRHRPDGTLAVDYEKLVAVAFQAIVELQEQVNQLKQRQ